jgi:hypothetical protein
MGFAHQIFDGKRRSKVRVEVKDSFKGDRPELLRSDSGGLIEMCDCCLQGFDVWLSHSYA